MESRVGASLLVASRAPVTNDEPQETSAQPRDCKDWHECWQLALEARDRKEFERFHDLAWRAVQTGPAKNPDLMYLLARAQSLSGRPHDALVMLGRLADMGFSTEVATDDDFRSVRNLPAWTELEARLNGSGNPIPSATNRTVEPARIGRRGAAGASGAAAARGGAPLPSRPDAVEPGKALRDSSSPASASPSPGEPAATPATGTPAAAPSSAGATAAIEPSIPPQSSPASPGAPRAGSAASGPRAENVLRVPGTSLRPNGLAYDGVSGRFVVADESERKLVVIDERSSRVIDLVRGASAGFYGVTALEIDPHRGDLWVASAATADPSVDSLHATALHKLQLVSGRLIGRYDLPDSQEQARFSDVAVTADGTVFVLDSEGGRIFRLRPGSHDLQLAATLNVDSPTSIAPMDARTLYVAHAAGIAIVDLMTGSSKALRAGKGVELTGFDHLRRDQSSLVGIQQMKDGSRRAARIRLTADRARSVDAIETDAANAEPAASAVSGNDFYFLTMEPQRDGDGQELVVRRARLR
ncbi:MAG TPA: hypothetical protein VNZ26_06080 [Vicinamibacterales bacterium]|nr:hypothetical protein [Vicinamibacterales bacterium]